MDPIAHTASWLTPATARPLAADDADPVFALIAEEARLEALAIEAQARGDEIFLTLPEDIRKGRVRVSFSDEPGDILTRSFVSEADLHRLVALSRRCATVAEMVDRRRRGEDFDAASADAEFDRIVGLDQALAQFRAAGTARVGVGSRASEGIMLGIIGLSPETALRPAADPAADRSVSK